MRVNGAPTQKAHYAVKLGDVLTFPLGPHIRVIKVVALGAGAGRRRRRSALRRSRSAASDAATACRVRTAFEEREPGAGRPTKRDGRRIAQLKSAEQG